MKKGTCYVVLGILASVVGYVVASRQIEETRDFR